MLSRWRSLEDEGRPCVRAHATAVVGPAMGDFNMPSKGKIRDWQDAVAREEQFVTRTGCTERNTGEH